MRRTLFVLLLAAAAACGGQQKPSTVPLPPEPVADTKPAEPPKAPPAAPAPAPEPAKPLPPIDVTIASPKVSVKLVSRGHGKRAALKLSPKAGDTQQVELAMDFTGKQSGPPEAGGDHEETVPTLVLKGAAEVKSVDKDGKAQYLLTVNGTDARDAGQTVPVEQVKKVLESLQGLTIGGTVDANGAAGDVTLHMDKPDAMASSAIDLVRLTLPTWPVLPKEAIGVGAKWRVTTQAKLADKLDVTQTTDYELLEHKGSTWTIKGTTKVTGKDQDVPGDGGGAAAKLTHIQGQGTLDAAIVDGALYPTMKQTLATQFSATANAPDPAAPDDPKKGKDITVTFSLKQGAQVTPQAPGAAAPVTAPAPAPATAPAPAAPAAPAKP